MEITVSRVTCSEERKTLVDHFHCQNSLDVATKSRLNQILFLLSPAQHSNPYRPYRSPLRPRQRDTYNCPISITSCGTRIHRRKAKKITDADTTSAIDLPRTNNIINCPRQVLSAKFPFCICESGFMFPNRMESYFIKERNQLYGYPFILSTKDTKRDMDAAPRRPGNFSKR